MHPNPIWPLLQTANDISGRNINGNSDSNSNSSNSNSIDIEFIV
jgi:hypothetical protein